MDLPQELQYEILEYTEFVTPCREITWILRKGSICIISLKTGLGTVHLRITTPVSLVLKLVPAFEQWTVLLLLTCNVLNYLQLLVSTNATVSYLIIFAASCSDHILSQKLFHHVI